MTGVLASAGRSLGRRTSAWSFVPSGSVIVAWVHVDPGGGGSACAAGASAEDGEDEDGQQGGAHGLSNAGADRNLPLVPPATRRPKTARHARLHIPFTRYPAPRMARLSQVFTGKDRVFFDLFEEAAANVVRGADLLDQMLAHHPDRADLARDIVICEQEGDRITHDVHQRLNSTFVTPIDREDVLKLVSDLDDIIDLIDEVADYLGLYKIEAPMEQSQRLAHVAPAGDAADRRGDAAAALVRPDLALHG